MPQASIGVLLRIAAGDRGRGGGSGEDAPDRGKDQTESMPAATSAAAVSLPILPSVTAIVVMATTIGSVVAE